MSDGLTIVVVRESADRKTKVLIKVERGRMFPVCVSIDSLMDEYGAKFNFKTIPSSMSLQSAGSLDVSPIAMLCWLQKILESLNSSNRQVWTGTSTKQSVAVMADSKSCSSIYERVFSQNTGFKICEMVPKHQPFHHLNANICSRWCKALGMYSGFYVYDGAYYHYKHANYCYTTAREAVAILVVDHRGRILIGRDPDR